MNNIFQIDEELKLRKINPIDIYEIKLPKHLRIYFRLRSYIKIIFISFLCFYSLFYSVCLSFRFTTGEKLLDVLFTKEKVDYIHDFTLDTILYLFPQLEEIDHKCIFENHIREIFRKPSKCQFCKNLKKIDHIKSISREEFQRKYAYSGIPVVITDATNNWTARDVFSFEFLRSIYSLAIFEENRVEHNYKLMFNEPLKFNLTQELDLIEISNEQNIRLTCQFFNYKSDFINLQDFLLTNLSAVKSDYPWYVGWSNCNEFVAKILRQHYSKPYFLPLNSQSYKADWIFIGLPGYGASMHVDFVSHPSWQAQLQSTKLWTLKPPAECFYECESSIQVVVSPGDIIVLDTDLWYHQTKIIGADISITIGAEYD